MELYHDVSGHFGIGKTLEKVKENYYFKGMRRFVTKYVKACLNCLYYKTPSGRKPGFLHPIEKIAIPFHTLHLDYIGPFILSKRKRTQILTIVDGYTKFCILEAVRSTATKHVSFCKDYAIKHVLNAVATPRANGQCERVNRTVLDAVATTCAGKPEETWDENVKQVQSAINNIVSQTTRSTPAKLLYGYQPRSMADAVLLSAIQETLDRIDLEDTGKVAKNNIDVEQGRQKKSFDAKRYKPPKYSLDDVVMVKVSAAPAMGDSRKLNAKAKGPFKVRAVLPND